MDKEIRLGRFDKWGYKNSFSKGELVRQLTYMNRDYDKLEQQCKKQKEINQKAIEYIKERFYFNEETGEYALLHTFDKCNAKELLDILNEVSE